MIGFIFAGLSVVVLCSAPALYVIGLHRGIAAERLRVQYIFASAHQVVTGGAIWIIAERLFGDGKDEAWMLSELRKYIAGKETRKSGEQNTRRLRWSLGEAEALVNAEWHRYQAAIAKDPAAHYDVGAHAEAYGMLCAAVQRYLNEPPNEGTP